MAKGNYNVKASENNDSSYRSCLCAMLIFVALCAIIILASVKWGGKTKESPDSQHQSKNDVEVLAGKSSSGKFEQLNMATTNLPKTITTISRSTTTNRTSPATSKKTTTTSTTRTFTSSTTKPTTITLKKTGIKSSNISTIYATGPTYLENLTNATNSVALDGKASKPMVIDLLTTTPAPSSSEVVKENVKISINQSDKKNKTMPIQINWEEPLTTLTTESESSESTNVTESSFKIGDKLHKTTQVVKAAVVKVQNVTRVIVTSQSKNENMNITERDTEDFEESIATTPWSDGGHVNQKKIENEENTTKIEEFDVNSNKTKVTQTTENRTIENSSKMESTTTFAERLRKVSDETVYPKRDTTTTASTPKIIRHKFPLPQRGTTDERAPMCKKSGCESESSNILNMMDHSADACENFYEFSCGGTYNQRHQDTYSEKLIDLIHKIRDADRDYLKKVQSFYTSCLEYVDDFNYPERVKNVRSILDATGHTMHLEDDPGNLNLTDLFAQIVLSNSLPIFDVRTALDPQTSQLTLKITLSGESSSRDGGVPDWKSFWGRSKSRCSNMFRKNLKSTNASIELDQLYEQYDTCRKNRWIYMRSVERSTAELGYFSNLSHTYNVSQKRADLRMTVDLDLLSSLDDLPSSETTNRKLHNMDYIVHKVSDLQSNYPLIDWLLFFRTITGDVYGIQTNTTVQVYFWESFKNVFKKLVGMTKVKLNNALLAIYANDLYQYMVLQNDVKNRPAYCIDLTLNLFKDITAKLYFKSVSTREADQFQETIKRIFESLVYTFENSLNSASWLAEQEKLMAVIKLKKLNLTFFDLNNRLLADDYLDAKYKDLNIQSNTFENNVDLAVRAQRKHYYKMSTGQIFDRDVMFAYYLMPYESKPLTFYATNLIGVPIGLLKNHYYTNLPANYLHVKLGIHLAKAISKHFDPIGIRYRMKLEDSSLHIYKSLEAEMGKISEFKTSRSVDKQIINYVFSNELAIADKISDNSALNVTIESSYLYENVSELLPWVSQNYSSEKLLYIGIMQEYCEKVSVLEFMREMYELDELPTMLKVENMVGNSPKFKEVFNCPDGSTMDFFPKYEFPFLDELDFDEENISN